MYHHMAHLSGFRGRYATKVASAQNVTKKLQVIVELYVITRQQVFSNYSLNITYILQLFVIFGNFEILREIHVIKCRSGSF